MSRREVPYGTIGRWRSPVAVDMKTVRHSHKDSQGRLYVLVTACGELYRGAASADVLEGKNSCHPCLVALVEPDGRVRRLVNLPLSRLARQHPEDVSEDLLDDYAAAEVLLGEEP